MHANPFTADNALPKDFVAIPSQLQELFVHPWVLNVPENEKDYISSKSDQTLPQRLLAEVLPSNQTRTISAPTPVSNTTNTTSPGNSAFGQAQGNS